VSRPRVVIAGAGFAGLTCARALKRAPVDVLLIDRNNYHLFTPLLYQVASALLDPGEIARPVRQLIRPLRHAEFLLANVTGADFEKRQLLTDHGPLPYDYLVLATGSQSDYFGKAALEQHAFERTPHHFFVDVNRKKDERRGRWTRTVGHIVARETQRTLQNATARWENLWRLRSPGNLGLT